MPVSRERRKQLREEKKKRKANVRPGNGFMQFRRVVSSAVAGEQTAINQNELSKILGDIWASLKPEERNSFEWSQELLQALHTNTASNNNSRPRQTWIGGNFILTEYQKPPS
ncbi:10012_t:CDS:1 [Paraglomus brasilianum]|uniref:10012_t:CDS:1 n=1 Tax=Paraglomus brasilianum TaxID=144538 RepID=A0A9N9EVP8_9GLOM|nr:10012_t:CDS:1 [Paraglomus brasilianum]